MRCGVCKTSRYPTGLGPRGKTGVKVMQPAFPVLFRQYFPQPVGLGMGETGQCYGCPGYILLINHDAEGLIQHISQKRVDRVPFAAMEPSKSLPDE